MDVILMERVGKLGHIGETVRVKDGYARNFLFPQGLAIPLTGAFTTPLTHTADTNTTYAGNTLNELPGEEWLYFTKSIWGTAYPSELGHAQRKSIGIAQVDVIDVLHPVAQRRQTV